jgi:hypothetical protein
MSPQPTIIPLANITDLIDLPWKPRGLASIIDFFDVTWIPPWRGRKWMFPYLRVLHSGGIIDIRSWMFTDAQAFDEFRSALSCLRSSQRSRSI